MKCYFVPFTMQIRASLPFSLPPYHALLHHPLPPKENTFPYSTTATKPPSTITTPQTAAAAAAPDPPPTPTIIILLPADECETVAAPADPVAVIVAPDEAEGEEEEALSVMFAFVLAPVYLAAWTPVPLLHWPAGADVERVMSAHCDFWVSF